MPHSKSANTFSVYQPDLCVYVSYILTSAPSIVNMHKGGSWAMLLSGDIRRKDGNLISGTSLGCRASPRAIL